MKRLKIPLTRLSTSYTHITKLEEAQTGSNSIITQSPHNNADISCTSP
jgi:hypothetical protein